MVLETKKESSSTGPIVISIQSQTTSLFPCSKPKKSYRIEQKGKVF